jgi:hypothetical protein
MSDLRDFTGKNRIFTGTDAETITSGTTAQRIDGSGKLRFNTTTNLMEYYTGTDWKAIDAPPIVTAITIAGGADITSGTIDNESVSDITIEVKGSLFDTTGGVVTFVGGNTVSTQTITRNSANLLTCTVTPSNFTLANSPYTVKVTNGSGLSAELADAITVDQTTPTFTNAADTTYSIFDGLRSSGTIAAADLVGATGTVGATPYSVSTGSLPTGFTLNTANGNITWSSVSAVGSDTTTTFSITVTGDDANATRQFKITVKAPVSETFSSTGAQTFSVPTGITSVDVLVVAGGGGGGPGQGGGGGAGGLIYRPGFPVTPGGNVSLNVGAGGPVGNTNYPNPGGTSQGGQRGYNTTFGNLTAIGGGYGWGDDHPGTPGGSGGAASDNAGSIGGNALQPGQPGDSGTYGFGNNGGRGGPPMDQHAGGGGGGAGAAGQGAEAGKQGGIGRAYSISGSSVYYAGGGRGGWGPGRTGGSTAQQQGGGGGGGSGGQRGGDGIANRGGGGGGSGNAQPMAGQGSSGGSGVVIVSY